MPPKTLFGLLAIAGVLLYEEATSAQTLSPSVRTPQADNTLGTQVSGPNNNFTVTGGFSRGQTLFHSFTDFSIPTGGSANFTRPVGNRDIITRVTGNLFSDLNGTLNTNGANFLLINPNGVVFGPNVRLDVGKSFSASTANGVELFDSQGQRYTFGTNLSNDIPLLSIDPNVFLNISKLNLGANIPGNPGIINYGTLQTPNHSQYIGLIGGNITLDGRYGGGKIVAPGGRIDLGGLNTAGTVSTDSQGLVFRGNDLTRGDVSTTNGTAIDVLATKALGTVDVFFSDVASLGSNVNIHANRLNMSNASITAGLSTNSGIQTTTAGDININAIGQVSLDNSSARNLLRSGADGKIGDIKINANSLTLINKSEISTATSGKGNAGNIEINTSGDISISGSTPQSTDPITLTSMQSDIASVTFGQGNAGKISINTHNQGTILLSNKAFIASAINLDAVGNGNEINISARELNLKNASFIASANVGGKGNSGNINIQTTGDIGINKSYISSDTFLGQGNAGEIAIDTQNLGKISLTNNAYISSGIGQDSVGNGNDINIYARSIDLQNASSISSSNTGGKGNAGNINIKTIGDISISGSTPQSTEPITKSSKYSSIITSTSGQGNAGKITIDTQDRGQLLLSNHGGISSGIGAKAVGNSNDINISAIAVDLRNGSLIFSSNIGGKGNAGNINIKTIGDVSISGSTSQSIEPITQNSNLSFISSNTFGQGDAGKITIDTQNAGKLSLSNKANISSNIEQNAIGNSGGIEILAKQVDVRNKSSIESDNIGGKGNAGNIVINTFGDISLSGTTSDAVKPLTSNSNIFTISSTTGGQGNAGKIEINTHNRGKLSLTNNAIITNGIGKNAVGNGSNIEISARGLDIQNQSAIASTNIGGKGDTGNITIQSTGAVDLIDGSGINSTNLGQGSTGNIAITSDRLTLNHGEDNGGIQSKSTGATGGNIQITLSDKLLLRNTSLISTNSDSTGQNGNGGKITISSPLIIALPGNNDISANAYAGTGGTVNITSQGIFGIKYRLAGSSVSSDITASSTFGQSGNVNIDTPGTDPGKDSTELPNVPTDASNQISQACSATNRDQKFTVTGRGGLPPTAKDLLAGDVVWQDARRKRGQSAISSATNNRTLETRQTQLPPPAIGLVFDGKGKVTLVAAGSPGQPTGTQVICPEEVR